MYTVYKITNNVNGKYYIGVHKTENPFDSYFGSGKAIKEAIIKYGKENFHKDVLLLTEDRDMAYQLERSLTVDYDKRHTYNMKLGGVGGFDKETARKGMIAQCRNAGKKSVEKGYGFGGEKQIDPKIAGAKGGRANKGKQKSPEHIEAIKETWRRKKLTSSNG